MRRYFNTECLCDPEFHYMVKLDEGLRMIKERYAGRGKYFVINRGRPFGKTATLRALSLKSEFDMNKLFQQMSY